MTLTFNELRRIKDNLPPGSMKKIADRISVSEQTVRNYFGACNYKEGQCLGVHFEQGPDGGLVTFDDPTILKLAKELVQEDVHS